MIGPLVQVCGKTSSPLLNMEPWDRHLFSSAMSYVSSLVLENSWSPPGVRETYCSRLSRTFLKLCGLTSVSQGALHGTSDGCQTNRRGIWYATYWGDKRQPQQSHSSTGKFRAAVRRPRPGKLKRMDKRVDGLNRDAASRDDRFRPAATDGPAKQTHGCVNLRHDRRRREEPCFRVLIGDHRTTIRIACQ